MFICVEFSPKNMMLNLLRFSGGMGLRILSGEELCGDEDLAINMLGGMCSMTG